jgi:hypothetical protein
MRLNRCLTRDLIPRLLKQLPPAELNVTNPYTLSAGHKSSAGHTFKLVHRVSVDQNPSH